MTLNDFLLTNLVNYGIPLFGLVLFVGALGIPLPSSLLVIVAGVFVREESFNGLFTFIVGLLASVTGDMMGYGIGRFARQWSYQRFGQSITWQNAQSTFNRRGGLAIYLTRFLITLLALPTNLIAGSSNYPFHHFLLYDVTGQATWLGVYGGAGYLFSSQWELISEFLSNFSGLLLGLVVLGSGFYLWRKYNQ